MDIYQMYGQLEKYASKLEELLQIYGLFTDKDLEEIRKDYIKPTVKE